MIKYYVKRGYQESFFIEKRTYQTEHGYIQTWFSPTILEFVTVNRYDVLDNFKDQWKTAREAIGVLKKHVKVIKKIRNIEGEYSFEGVRNAK